MYVKLLQLLGTYLIISICHYLIKFADDTLFKKTIKYNKIKNDMEKEYRGDILQDKLNKEDKSRQWYLLHAIANGFISVVVFLDCIKVLMDPLISVATEFNTLGLAMAITLHFHHIMISMKDMSIIDWIHHMVSCMLVGFLSMFYIKGLIINYTLFFICGVPGGIDFLLLALNKYGLVDRMTEKKINVFLNMWIRLPGILYGCFSGWICYLYNGTTYNILLYILIIFLNLYNSIYFAELVVKNYGEHLQKNKNNKVVDG